MATKEIINLKSEYEDFDFPARPANQFNTEQYQNRPISKEAEAKIYKFRKEHLGRAALRSVFNLDKVAA